MSFQLTPNQQTSCVLTYCTLLLHCYAHKEDASTKHPIQWILEFFPLGVKRQSRKVVCCPLSSAEVKNEWSYTSFANKKIFQSKLISKKAKLKLYFSVIRPVVTYACETWILKEKITNRLMVFERKILRKIFDPTYENGSWRIKTNQELDKIIKHNKLRQSARARMVWSYRKNARNKNGQSNTLLETHFKEGNGETKDTLGG